jgi:hypothetical protein
VKTKRHYAGVHYLLVSGLNYLVNHSITGHACWGSRKDAVRFDEWDARKTLRVLRKGDGMMIRPIKDAKLVKVTVYLRRPK